MNLSILSKKQLQILDENHLNWKKGEITGVRFMKMLELKKNTFYKIMIEVIFLLH
ncbi:hypothetical protein J2S09_000968 [Bacillus fengqiuensis]|nr:hypothetical protein [Bacillus fengqiuensis]